MYLNDAFAGPADANDTIRRPLPSDPARTPAAGLGLPPRPFPGGFPDTLGRPPASLRAAPPSADEFSPLDFGPDPDVLSSAPAARRGDDGVERAFDVAALNPLVSAASPLLWLAARLNESLPPDDIRAFRDRTIDAVRRFETAAMARGIPSRAVRIARYALCATIDDIILNTAWAGSANWATHGLVSSLYNETWGGERFFDLLNQLYLSPEEHIDTLELMAICLSIGFVGKFRVVEGGQSHLNRLRAELYRTLRRVRGPYERDLSTAWQGVVAPHRAPPGTLPYWIIAGLALLALIGAYAAWSITLKVRMDAAAERLAALLPMAPISVDKPPIPEIPAPRVVQPVVLTQVQRISAVLQRDIAEGRVEVVGSPATVSVRLLAASFPSGGAGLAESEAPLLQRIAASLDKERGPIRVIGHTDNVPVGLGSILKNNEALSLARAEAVAAMLTRHLASPERVSAEGRGDREPILSNATAEGRARNRRVELQIPAEETLR